MGFCNDHQKYGQKRQIKSWFLRIVERVGYPLEPVLARFDKCTFYCIFFFSFPLFLSRILAMMPHHWANLPVSPFYTTRSFLRRRGPGRVEWVLQVEKDRLVIVRMRKMFKRLRLCSVPIRADLVYCSFSL